MMQGDQANYGPSSSSSSSSSSSISSSIPVPQPPSATPDVTTATATTFPSTSSSTSGRILYTHHQDQYQGLHRRRGSAASDTSSPSSPSHPSSSISSSRHLSPAAMAAGVGGGAVPIDVSTTFNPENLFRQQPQQQQLQRHQMASNKDPSYAHALHPNITHHNSNSSNKNNKNNKNKISSPFFQEITVATSAPLDNSSSINNNIYTSLTLQPNHLHPQQQQQGHEQGYRYHSHAATADSLASLGGGGPGGGGGEGVCFNNYNDDDNDAEFEVRVIANRTNVGKDNNNNNTEDEIQCTQRYEPFDDDNRAPPCLATTTATTSNGAHSPRESQQPLQSGASEAAAVKPKRLQSLDILRGITIIFMVLVNTQGADPFEQLEHSPWFGYTLADWVFPNFIFMVGMAIAIVLSPTKLVALSRSVQEQQQQEGVTSSSFSPSIWRRHEARIKISLKTIKRSLILFAIGLALNGLEMIGTPAGGWIRIPGVLQRIGFCYLVIALTVLWSPVRNLATPSVSTITATGNSNNEAPNKRDRAHTHTITRVKASRRSSGTTTLMAVPKTFESSRRIRIGLPLICTILWFILTYSIQSSATEPIPSCLYPPQATSTTSSSSSTNNTDIVILPGFAPSRGQLSPPWCTAQSVVDTWLFTRDRDSNGPIFDAEGSLGTLMAIVSGWFGWMVGSMVVEQQRKWKVVVKRVVDQFEDEVKVGEEEEEEERERKRERERERERGRRRRREVVDQSPKDISESSSSALEQQQQLPYSTPSTAFPPQTMESIHLPAPPSPSPSLSSSLSTTDELQIRLTTHQRTFLLAHLGEWFMAGICIMFSGTILGWFLPICKGLWSPSFTLYSAGISINVLCILMYLYDVPSSSLPTSSSTSMTTTSTSSLPTKQITRQPRINNFLHASLNILTPLIQKTGQFFTKLLTCYGRNPTLIYILSELVKIILEKIPAHESRHAWVQTVWSYLFFNTFYEVMPPAWASLVFSSVYILVFAPLLWGLDRKGVYLRV